MRIAIIGAGVSGLVSAYLLCRDHDIVVYEANDYAGGHTNTVDVDVNGLSFPVDTGFIVFNEKTYPNFVSLLKRLGVTWQPSKMSFSVHCERTGLEYSPTSFNSLFAQRRNLFRPAFLKMLQEIFRFRKASEALIASRDDLTTLADYLKKNRYSKGFVDHFIIPMGSAIWSADPALFEGFPARYFAAFFHNHGFLQIRDKPQWLVIRGGSRQYVVKLIEPFKDKIRTSCPVTSVSRKNGRVEVRDDTGGVDTFDRCILAAHSDQALAMLSDPTEAERKILGAIPYQKNRTVLHTDPSLLPFNRSCRAAWNSIIPRTARQAVALTYSMNILQNLQAPVEFCVTLNHVDAIDPNKIIREITYHHPVYTSQGLAARQKLHEINGKNNTFYCGAYWGYGFHEDGVKSALAVCEAFGKSL